MPARHAGDITFTNVFYRHEYTATRERRHGNKYVVGASIIIHAMETIPYTWQTSISESDNTAQAAWRCLLLSYRAVMVGIVALFTWVIALVCR